MNGKEERRKKRGERGKEERGRETRNERREKREERRETKEKKQERRGKKQDARKMTKEEGRPFLVSSFLSCFLIVFGILFLISLFSWKFRCLKVVRHFVLIFGAQAEFGSGIGVRWYQNLHFYFLRHQKLDCFFENSVCSCFRGTVAMQKYLIKSVVGLVASGPFSTGPLVFGRLPLALSPMASTCPFAPGSDWGSHCWEVYHPEEARVSVTRGYYG